MAGDLVQVHLLGLPVQARTRFSQHLQELTRELSLIHIGAEQGAGASLPLRLLQIADQMDTTYAAFRAAPDAVVEAALAAGEDFCDVIYTVPAHAGGFVRALGQVLDEADEFCRAEQHLLSLPASQEVVAYRQWFVGEATRQLAGAAPRPWRHASPSPLPPAPRTEAPASVVSGGLRHGGVGELVGEPLVMASIAGSVATARRHVRAQRAQHRADVATGRGDVRAVLRSLGAEELEESAELGVSELVTNAVLHARTEFSLAVRSLPQGRVRIEVRDSSPAPLQPRHFTMTSTTGRGLQLVDSLSSDWGAQELPAGSGPGKVVWFEPRRVDDAPLTDLTEWDLEALL